MEISQSATITKEELANQVIEFYKKECSESLTSFLNGNSGAIWTFNEYTNLCSTRGKFLESDSESSHCLLNFVDKWCCHCSEKFFIDNANIIDVLLLLESKGNFTIKMYLSTR